MILEPFQFFPFQNSSTNTIAWVHKVLAKMGHGWQADWVTAKIFFSNLRTHEMNKCWKFQADILIHVWFRAKRLKICCNQWTPNVHQGPTYTHLYATTEFQITCGSYTIKKFDFFIKDGQFQMIFDFCSFSNVVVEEKTSESMILELHLLIKKSCKKFTRLWKLENSIWNVLSDISWAN